MTKERIFNFITKTNTSIDQGSREAFEIMKTNGVISNNRKENESLILLLIGGTIHVSSVTNHQQK